MSDYINMLEQAGGAPLNGHHQLLRLHRGGVADEQLSQTSSVITLSSTNEDPVINPVYVVNPAARKVKDTGKVRKIKSPTPSRVKDRERRAFAKEQITTLKTMFQDQLKKGNMNDGQVMSLAVQKIVKLEDELTERTSSISKLVKEVENLRARYSTVAVAHRDLKTKSDILYKKWRIASAQYQYYFKKYLELCKASGKNPELLDLNKYIIEQQMKQQQQQQQAQLAPRSSAGVSQQRPVRFIEQGQTTRYVLTQNPPRPINIQRRPATNYMVLQPQPRGFPNPSAVLQTQMHHMQISAAPEQMDLSKVKTEVEEQETLFQVRAFNCEFTFDSALRANVPPPPDTPKNAPLTADLFKQDDSYFRSLQMFKTDYFWKDLLKNKLEWNNRVKHSIDLAFHNMKLKHEANSRSNSIDNPKRKRQSTTPNKKRKRFY